MCVEAECLADAASFIREQDAQLFLHKRENKGTHLG